jgi:hypothetical protein
MPRLELTSAEWRAVAHELGSTQTAPVPPGLVERIQALLARAPSDWPEEACALELDTSSADAVRAIHANLSGQDQATGQRAASVAEAMRIIRDHQQRG